MRLRALDVTRSRALDVTRASHACS